MAYDQVILIPGGGAPGTGAREVIDLLEHPELYGVTGDRRWRGWTHDRVDIPERVAEPSVGYDVPHNVTRAIRELERGEGRLTIQRVVTAGQGTLRRGWTRLSTDYRRRLERKGITRSAWEQGADLRAARGHAPMPPNQAANYEITMRYLTSVEERTPERQQALRAYNRRGVRPGWIPDGLSDDVVAALSQLRGTPAAWSGAVLVPAPAGEPWAMVVSYR